MRNVRSKRKLQDFNARSERKLQDLSLKLNCSQLNSSNSLQSNHKIERQWINNQQEFSSQAKPELKV